MGLYKRDRKWWLAFSRKGKMSYVSTEQTDQRLAEQWAISYQAAVQEGPSLEVPESRAKK